MPHSADPTETQPARRPQRLSSDARRGELIEATLSIIAEEGLRAATLRKVAERAGVSNGLIRHHFLGKRQMILDAYAATVERMTAPGLAALDRADLGPRRRLAAFVRASLDPGLSEPTLFSTWAAFVALVHVDADFESIHRAGYRDYQARFEPLIAAVLAEAGRIDATRTTADLAMQINALIDGLWIEASLLARDFPEGALIGLALDGVARILNIDWEEE